VEEGALKRAIVRAINRFNAEERATYLTLMKATIGDAIGLNGGSDEIDLLERRIDALNKRMIALVNESVRNGDDIESHEDEFKVIAEETEQLKRRIEAIRESEAKDESYAERLKSIQNTIDQREMNRDVYDDTIVRQMVECIKVFKDKRIVIIFGGGYEEEEEMK
jgi:hypothetical protein